MGNWRMIPNKAWCQRQWTYQQMRPICYVSFLNMLYINVLLFQWGGKSRESEAFHYQITFLDENETWM